jgi:CRISPR-associated protein Csy2
MTDTAAVLLLPRLRVQNANAIPGPLSWGFPAPTAFTGFVHALERRLRDRVPIALGGVAIVCHRFEPQIAAPAGRPNRVLRLTRNPVFAGWKRFEDKAAAIVEEGRAHLEVTLAIEVRVELDEDDRESLMDALLRIVPAMRLAGGSLLPGDERRQRFAWYEWPNNAAEQALQFRKLKRALLPGFALVLRDDLLAERLAALRGDEDTAGCDALDALLDLTRLNYEAAGPDPKKPNDTLWDIRTKPGWLVPLPVGYAALSPLYPPGSVRQTRDSQSPFRFVESIYSLGAWVSPHRMTTLDQLLWHLETDTAAGLYRCVNRFPTFIHPVTSDLD